MDPQIEKLKNVKIDLTKERYKGQLKINRDFVDYVDIQYLEDYLSDTIIAQFNRDFAVKKDTNVYNIETPTPRNDIERIRERYNILTRWIPIRYRIVSRVVEFEEKLIFPKVSPRKFDHHFRINSIYLNH